MCLTTDWEVRGSNLTLAYHKFLSAQEMNIQGSTPTKIVCHMIIVYYLYYRIQVDESCVLHLINLNREAYIVSAEISDLFWEEDILTSMVSRYTNFHGE